MEFKLKQPLINVLITQGFGIENTGREMLSLYKSLGLLGHNGLDYQAIDGTSIYASHGGIVMSTSHDGSGGLGVVIVTDETYDYNGHQVCYKTIYWHMKEGRISVSAGQKIKVGDFIGEADNTGLSTGSHLHFGLKRCLQGKTSWDWKTIDSDNGYGGAIDPTPFFTIQQIEFPNEMKKGDFNDTIMKMQAFFIRQGIMESLNNNEFGHYGPKTCRAVKKFMMNSKKLSLWEQLFWKGNFTGPKTLSELNNKYNTK